MATTTVTSKGQVTVPKAVREDLGLEPGSQLMFIKVGDGEYRVIARTGDIADLAGMLHRPGQPPLTVDEIDEGIAEGAAAAGGRGLAERQQDAG